MVGWAAVMRTQVYRNSRPIFYPPVSCPALYIARMVKTFEKAIAEVSNLPDADQLQIGRKLLTHIE
jgi:uncharacterized protein (DUF2225 family)